MDSPRKWVAVLSWAAAAVPVAWLLYAVSLYYLPFPWAEAWVMIPRLLERWHTGEFAIGDAYIALNGVHLFVPCMIQVVLGILTSWNQAFEVGFNVLIGAGLFGSVLVMLRRIASTLDRPYPHWLVPIFAVLIFSLNQSCNWMWGTQIATLLSVAAAAGGLLVLTAGTPGIARLCTAAALGLVSSFSFGSGLLFWPAGAVAIAFPAVWSGKPLRKAALLGWCLFSCLVFLVWFGTLQQQQAAPVASASFAERLWLTARFIPLYLGAGLTKFHLSLAFVPGVAALALGLWAHWLLWKKPRVPWEAIAPLTTLMLYALALGAAAAMKRGVQNASLSVHSYGGLLEGAALRYPAMALLYWLGLVVLMWMLMGSRQAEAPHGKAFVRRGALAAGMAVIVVMSILSGRTGYYEAQERYRFYAPLVRDIVVGELDTLPTRLQWPYGDPGREALGIMRARKLSFFREEARDFWEHTGARSNWDAAPRHE
jgi:hypothetical protein